MPNQPDKITFYNKISANFREIHVDGAYGGLTPRGLINLNFFAERFPIPKSSDFKVTGQSITEKIKDSDDSKEGIIREYEFGVYMDINTCKMIINLLTTKVIELENLIKEKDGNDTPEKQ